VWRHRRAPCEDRTGMSADGIPSPNRWTFFGIALVALSTLMYEVLLTRIFSVTAWYHFAFVAISVAMFGITAGALLVHLRPAWFPTARIHQQLAIIAAAYPLVLFF